MTKKSNLQPKPFATSSNNNIITRIADLKSVIEFLKERKLHFAPLSVYKDHTEGKKFTDLKEQDTQKNHVVPSLFRRKIMYASCWYNGDETLHMWDIYGNQNKRFAIQLKLDQFLQIGFHSKYFRFNSASLNEYSSRLKKNDEFNPSSLYYGNIDYVDLKNIDAKKYFIGRFKDKAFEHENEFRFLLRQNYNDAPLIDLKDLKCEFHSPEFKKLEINIFVSPYCDNLTFSVLVKQLQFNNKHKLKLKILPSNYRDLFNY